MPVARRLRALRWLFGGRENSTQEGFAAQLGLGSRRWSNFENGHPLSKEVALKIVSVFPSITLDWLWLGRTSGMTHAMAEELARAEQVVTGQETKLRRRPGAATAR